MLWGKEKNETRMSYLMFSFAWLSAAVFKKNKINDYVTCSDITNASYVTTHTLWHAQAL
jgi:hypothetical protein